MAEYTSLKGLVGGSQDQETLVALEATVDSVRFRFDGVPSDIAQERPAGFSRSMAEIMAHMRMQEEYFVEQLRMLLGERREPLELAVGDAPSPFMTDTNPLNDLAQFLQLREETLALLHRLTPEQWGHSGELGHLGRLEVRDLVQRVARQNDRALEEMAAVRRAVQGGTLPGNAGAEYD
jgi:hypothetical protein